MITSLGGTGGFVSPAFVGWVKTQTGSAQYGLIGLAVVLLAGVVLLLLVFPAPGRHPVGVTSGNGIPARRGFGSTQR
jgi:MFS-type transporter involved in bile tolerance (Atg22 family)